VAVPRQTDHITPDTSLLQAFVNGYHVRLNTSVRRRIDSQLDYAFEQRDSALEQHMSEISIMASEIFVCVTRTRLC
jgi:hypothetical protein